MKEAMNPLKRFWQSLQSRPNADDPVELAAFVDELNREVESLHRAVAAAIADEKRLKMQIEDFLARAADWESRAVLALGDGNEELAREALLKKDECEAQSLALHAGWESQKAATEKLKASLQAARLRVGEARTKYTLLLAQYRSATTKQKLAQTLSTTRPDSPMQLMERLTDRIRLIEAQAEADLELGTAEVASDLDAKFLALERRTKGDEALRLLKERLAERPRLADHSGQAARIEALKAKLDRD